VSLICFASCAVATPGSNRERPRSAENNTPRNLRRVDTAYPLRMSDMACLHLEYIACTPQFWPRHDGNRTDADVDPQCYRQVYAIIAKADCDQRFWGAEGGCGAEVGRRGAMKPASRARGRKGMGRA